MPARNEAAIIKQCLKALSFYTDAIVYLDDASDDNSVELVESLARECNIARIIKKTVWYRDEPADRNMLLNAGRDLGGTHFVVIDADEMFTANCLDDNWLRKKIVTLQPGDSLQLSWIHLWKETTQYRCDYKWKNYHKDFIFCDDKKCFYESEFIHTPRTPKNLSEHKFVVKGNEHGLMHFMYVDWQNFLIKQIWYKCFIRVRQPAKKIVAIK